MASLVRESGYDWDDFFIFAASGTDDFAYSSFKSQIQAMADVDIRPLIRELSFSADGEALILDAVVAAQNPGLNPALMATAVETCLPAYRPDFVRVRRLMLLDREGASFR